MLLGKAPHLDQQYTVFGKVLRGDAVLSELEQVKFIRFTDIGPLHPKSNAYQGRAHTSSLCTNYPKAQPLNGSCGALYWLGFGTEGIQN